MANKKNEEFPWCVLEVTLNGSKPYDIQVNNQNFYHENPI